MKIFANNFAVILSLKPEHKHFRFETAPLSEIAAIIRADKTLFPGQVWYIKAKKEENLLLDLKALQCDSEVMKKYGQIVVLFSNEFKRDDFFQAYQAEFSPIIAAGGLVVNPRNELLLIFREGRWDLPKGKLEKGEAVIDAAWREVAEETGVKHHKVGEKAAQTYHVFLGRGGKWRFKTTHWYYMYSQKAEKVVPQTKEGITKVAWKPLLELRDEIPRTYPQIMEMMRLAVYEGKKV